MQKYSFEVGDSGTDRIDSLDCTRSLHVPIEWLCLQRGDHDGFHFGRIMFHEIEMVKDFESNPASETDYP